MTVFDGHLEERMIKIALYGFNNLTKTLSFNIYDICYAKTRQERKEYLKYVDEQYNSVRLTKILTDVTTMIGATVLNIAKQDYDPQGASVTMLISEEPVDDALLDATCNVAKIDDLTSQTIVAHLDKSHVTVHTYPEYHPDHEISTFRVDIDVSTCGRISPLKALDYLIGSFDSDIITIDYRVRGFTRAIDGTKHFIDHAINSIQNFIDPQTLKKYEAIDVNVFQSNIFHTKLMIKAMDLNNYLFKKNPDDLPESVKKEIKLAIKEEMTEIYSGTNIYHLDD
jgi:S-adenosylmethionine decarboxylase